MPAPLGPTRRSRHAWPHRDLDDFGRRRRRFDARSAGSLGARHGRFDLARQSSPAVEGSNEGTAAELALEHVHDARALLPGSYSRRRPPEDLPRGAASRRRPSPSGTAARRRPRLAAEPVPPPSAPAAARCSSCGRRLPRRRAAVCSIRAWTFSRRFKTWLQSSPLEAERREVAPVKVDLPEPGSPTATTTRPRIDVAVDYAPVAGDDAAGGLRGRRSHKRRAPVARGASCGRQLLMRACDGCFVARRARGRCPLGGSPVARAPAAPAAARAAPLRRPSGSSAGRAGGAGASSSMSDTPRPRTPGGSKRKSLINARTASTTSPALGRQFRVRDSTSQRPWPTPPLHA